MGCIFSVDELQIQYADKTYCLAQFRPLSTWPDKSLKWVLCDFFIDLLPWQSTQVTFLKQEKKSPAAPPLPLKDGTFDLSVDTGACRFLLRKDKLKPFHEVWISGKNILDPIQTGIFFKGCNGKQYFPEINDIKIEERGALRVTIKIAGEMVPSNSPKRKSGLVFISRLTFWKGKTNCRFEFTIRNTKAAKHNDGYWDLGDPASFFIKELSASIGLQTTKCWHIAWKPNPGIPSKITCRPLCLYQDSSGGENWRSKNHLNLHGQIRRSFCGYKVFEKDGNILAEGKRASPEFALVSEDSLVSVSMENFWQNFPSALTGNDKSVGIVYFPSNTDEDHELQGGEQKTFIVNICFLEKDRNQCVSHSYQPLFVTTPAHWYQRANVFSFFSAQNSNDNKILSQLLNESVNGKNNFFSRRETIDEFGWRNFGDFFADHESFERIGHFFNNVIISHYNNQYDFLYSLLYHFAKTGEIKFFILAKDLAEHIIDIDIYHTTEDRDTFNKGLFWHTNHFLEAGTATHRSFSRRGNYSDSMQTIKSVGGGHSYEHAYTKGLLFYYFMSGDENVREAVLDLITWVETGLTIGNGVIAKIEEKILKFFKAFLNRGGSKPTSPPPFLFNGPGRASGNALSVMLDAYELTKDTKYIYLAERLIHRCVHPDEDISSREMLNPNTRQMYTIFLHALALYLDKKREMFQIDNNFKYARDVILHYGHWVKNKEYLFFTKPELLDFPNFATRTAQDIRKANILFIASMYEIIPEQKELLVRRAEFFYQSALEHIQNLETKGLTRPLAILMAVGCLKAYFDSQSATNFDSLSENQFFAIADKRDNRPWGKAWETATFVLSGFSIEREIRWIFLRCRQIAYFIKNGITKSS